MKTRIKRTTRHVGDPEPTTTDAIFALVFIVVMIGAFVLLWSDIAGDFARSVMAQLAGCRHHTH